MIKMRSLTISFFVSFTSAFFPQTYLNIFFDNFFKLDQGWS